MVTIAIAYHSTFGHTKAQAEAVAEGANSVADTQVALVDVTEIEDQWQVLRDADAIIFGAPTYMGSLSGKFKVFMDQMGTIWSQQQWADKLAAGFTSSSNASGDKLQSLIQLAVMAAQHGMHWVNLGLMPGDVRQPDDADNLNRLGGWLGAMAQCMTEEGAALLTASDAETARHLGYRVATLARRLAVVN